jgi:hypothetical protein
VVPVCRDPIDVISVSPRSHLRIVPKTRFEEIEGLLYHSCVTFRESITYTLRNGPPELWDANHDTAVPVSRILESADSISSGRAQLRY